MKKMLALLLAFVMVLSLFAGCGNTADVDVQKPTPDVKNAPADDTQAAVESEYPEYLNLDSPAPIIKDEAAGTIKLKVAIVQSSIGGNWEDLWLSKYLKDKYNVEFEVETILDTAVGDRKTLMMASGELPDIMISMNFSTAELYQYGLEEGLLLQCDQYINETLTPNLYAYMQNDAVRKVSTLPDGHVYSMPWIFASDDVALYHADYINKAWLDELGLDVPKTLDEYVAALYAMKEANISGVGSENIYPFSGGMNLNGTNANTYFLLNALGYVTWDDYGTEPALRNGEVVIPAYDLDTYQEFLKLMHQFKEDGIIAPNFFTTDSTESIARLQNGQSGIYYDEVHSTGYEKFADWVACYPLTSQWSAEPVTAIPNTIQMGGGFVISADTEYPELCMRVANLWFDNTTSDLRALWVGPGVDTEYDYGYGIQTWDAEKETITDVKERFKGLDAWTYIMQELVGFYPSFGAIEDTPSMIKRAEALGGHYEPADFSEYKEEFSTNGESWSRYTTANNVAPYGKEAFPTVYYVDAETQERITDLTTVINPYIEEQVAQFVMGNRKINDEEIAAFKEELNNMGIEELLEIYKEIYIASK